jgi:hypothetical protein
MTAYGGACHGAQDPAHAAAQAGSPLSSAQPCMQSSYTGPLNVRACL